MTSRDVIRIIKADGWRQVRQVGSHCQFRHPDKSGTVTVPHPKREMAIGTLKSIERATGIKIR